MFNEVYGMIVEDVLILYCEAYNLPIRLSEDYKKTVGIRDSVELLDIAVKHPL